MWAQFYLVVNLFDFQADLWPWWNRLWHKCQDHLLVTVHPTRAHYYSRRCCVLWPRCSQVINKQNVCVCVCMDSMVKTCTLRWLGVCDKPCTCFGCIPHSWAPAPPVTSSAEEEVIENGWLDVRCDCIIMWKWIPSRNFPKNIVSPISPSPSSSLHHSLSHTHYLSWICSSMRLNTSCLDEMSPVR